MNRLFAFIVLISSILAVAFVGIAPTLVSIPVQLGFPLTPLQQPPHSRPFKLIGSGWGWEGLFQENTIEGWLLPVDESAQPASSPAKEERCDAVVVLVSGWAMDRRDLLGSSAPHVVHETLSRLHTLVPCIPDPFRVHSSA